MYSEKARDYTYVQWWMPPSEGSYSMSKSDRFACHVSAIAGHIRVRKDALPAAEKKDMELFQK